MISQNEKVKDKYKLWTTNEYFDIETRQELLQLSDESEIRDRFYRDLEFGTGGIRGVIGAGTNRINRYIVRKATQGLADYIKLSTSIKQGVAIAYDSRNMSKEFAMEAALCLCANGIKAYVFDELRPTPELSYAVRRLGCIAGIVITASHNPAEYNGYKVYWEDGAQIISPHDKEIIRHVNRIQDYDEVKSISEQEARKQELLINIGDNIDTDYLEEIKKLSLNPSCIQRMGDEIKIVYTPLHGTGNIPVRTILKQMGFDDVFIVSEQETPDGGFPTVRSPNPEDKKAFTLALQYAKEKNADIVLATDPDADRLGVCVKDIHDETYKMFTGNMSGVLLMEYILSQKKENGILPQNGAVVTTIVTSDMVKTIADSYNVKWIETLTGFKYIGEQIKLFEEEKSYQYLFGMEESYGCLTGTYTRDKDAVSAVAMLCEAAAYYKEKGLTLWEQMCHLYEKYGYFKEGLETIICKGEEGVEKIQQIMERLRKNTPNRFGKWEVEKFIDYQNNSILPKSNVLYFKLSNDSWCCVRPSGTEPKIKFYMGVKAQSLQSADSDLEELKNEVFLEV